MPINTGIYREIQEDYDNKKRIAQQKKERRLQEVYLNVPEFEELDEKIRRAGVAIGRIAIKNAYNPGSVSINEEQEAKKQLDILVKEKAELLEKKGYPKDYLTNVFECALCEDSGYFTDNNGIMQRCSCYKQKLIEKLLENSNVSDNNATFDEFDIEWYPKDVNEKKYGINESPREHMINIQKHCRNFVDNITSESTKNMVFTGKAGLGKTFLCNAISLDLIKKGIPVMYLTAPMLFSSITFYGNNEKKREAAATAHDMVMNTEILIIDDLGTEKQTESRYAELLEILNTRELNGKSRICKTILSTNLDPRNIFEFYGERVGSRIIGGFDILRFVGDDIRLAKVLNN